jgi:hypothetical protein
MNGLIFVPEHNTPGINPKTGHAYADANEFQSQARMFADYHKAHGGHSFTVVKFDNAKPFADRFADIKVALNLLGHQLDCLVLMSHGWPDGVQIGVTRKNVDKLVAAVLPCLREKKLILVLDCCSTGEDGIPGTNDNAPGPGGEGGFCDKTCDSFRASGVDVTGFGHVNAAHTTKNPKVKVFTGIGVGGKWLIEPNDPRFPVWDRALHKKNGTLQFEFPFMSQAELDAALAA